mgnify:CR=1 FL=1
MESPGGLTFHYDLSCWNAGTPADAGGPFVAHFAHVYNYEGGGVSFNSGVSCRLITGNQGRITAQQIEEVINPTEFYHMPKTRLVCLENTTNKGGGAFYDFEEIRKIKTLCDKHQLGLHLDGARLWNALLETTEQPQDYGQTFDSISVCLSKGLGCPVGSVLLGSEAFIQQALRIRKVFGGGMRQAGYLAAAGIYAIDHQWEDMRQDHQKAKELAEILYSCDYVKKIEPVCTNIIIFSLLDSANELNFVEQMRQQDIHFMRLGKGKLRMVTHRDYTVEQHQVVLSTLKKMKL